MPDQEQLPVGVTVQDFSTFDIGWLDGLRGEQPRYPRDDEYRRGWILGLEQS